MKAEGVYDPQTVERVATMEGLVAGTVNSLIELLPFDNLFLHNAGADRLIKRIVRQTFLEGSTESAQEAVNVLVEKLGHKPNQTLSENAGRILEAGIIGGALGGGAGATIGTHEHSRNFNYYDQLAAELHIKEDIFSWKKAGLNDKEVTSRVEERLANQRKMTADMNRSLPDEKQPLLPDVDSREMTEYVLYGNDSFKKESGIFGKASEKAKTRVYRAMGMKLPGTDNTESAMPAPDQAPMSSSNAESKTIVTEGQRQEILDENKSKENKAAGLALFDKVVNEDITEQNALEQARTDEITRRNEETARIAAEEENRIQEAIKDARDQQNALKGSLAGNDVRKQTIVDDVLNITERSLLTAVQKETGLTVVPAGPGLYTIDTPQGPQPVNLFQVRERLAAKRIADLDAKDAKELEDTAALQKAQEEREAKRIAAEEASTLKHARAALAGFGITSEQRTMLENNRDKLTEDEISRLDMPGQKKTASVSVTSGLKDSIISENENPDYRPPHADEEQDTSLLVRSMLADLDNSSKSQAVYDSVTGTFKRHGSGIAWLTDANKAGGINVDRVAARTVLEKVQNSETLTPRQQDIFNALVRASSRHGGTDLLNRAFWAKKGFLPVPGGKIEVDDLVEGDSFVIAGEEFRATDIDDTGNVTLKDGTIRTVRAGSTINNVDFIKQVEEAPEFNPGDYDNSVGHGNTKDVSGLPEKMHPEASSHDERETKAQQGIAHDKPGEKDSLTYDQFAAAYREAWHNGNKYTPEQAGFNHHTEVMANLADEYPKYLERLEAEEEEKARSIRFGGQSATPSSETAKTIPATAKVEKKIISPKEQKKYLLEKIDEAMKAAPDETVDIPKHNYKNAVQAQIGRWREEDKALFKEYKEKFGTVTIEVPNDGTFTILNTKSSLERFKKQTQKFPASVVKDSPEPKPALRSNGPTGKRVEIEGVSYYNEFKPRKQELITEKDENRNRYTEDGFFTDGRYAVKTEKPKIKLNETRPLPEIKRTIPEELFPANIVAEFSDGLEDVKTAAVHVVGENGVETALNAHYVDAILTLHPQAKVFVGHSDKKTVVFKTGKDVVGVCAPLRNAAPFKGFINEFKGDAEKEFVTAPDGSIDFGQNSKDTAEIIKRTASPVRLTSSNVLPSTGPVNTSTFKQGNTEDSGAELAYNKRNRIRAGIKWEDIADKNTALKVKETTKQNVYPKPDYQALIDNGGNPLMIHIIKQVYDSMAIRPVTRNTVTDDDLRLYINAANRVMNGTLKWAGDKDAIAAWAGHQMGSTGSGQPVSLARMAHANRSLLDMIYPDGWENYRAEVHILGGNKLLGALQPGYDEGKRALRDINAGWPTKQESWQKQGYSIEKKEKATVSKGNRHNKDGTKTDLFFVRIMDRSHGEGFLTRGDAQQAIADLKPFLLLDKYKRIAGQYDTEEEASEAAREKVKRENKPDISEKGISVESAERIGSERRLEGENISSDKLRETFGFKGVNFGNWMKGDTNEAERQLHLNHAYDSFFDLAEILNVPPEAMSLNGMLGVAIGAQGTGKHAAHFVPGINEINLTRTSGAGSLTHEFGHALDHYFAKLSGLEAVANPFLTDNISGVDPKGYINRSGQKVKAFGEGIRPEIVSLFKSIVMAINKKTANVTAEQKDAEIKARKEDARKRLEGWIKYIRKDFAKDDMPWEPFDKLADRIMNLDLGEGKICLGRTTYISPVVSEIRDLYKKHTGRIYPLETVKSIQSNIDHYAYVNSEDYGKHIPQERTVSTDYSKEAARLDKGKSKGYWNTEREKFARAFDAYVSDALEAKAARNTYLSHYGKNDVTVPKGTEREAINKAFDNLINEIRTRSTDKGVEMFSVEEENAIREDKESFAMQLDDYAAGKLKKDAVLAVCRTPHVLELLGAKQLPVVIDQDTIRKTIGEKHGLSINDLKQIPAQINDPVMVFNSATVTDKDSLVVMTSLLHQGRTVIVAIHLGKETGRHKVNDIASIHPRKSDHHFLNWIDQGFLRYYHKGKARNWFMTRGLQLPKVRGTNPSFGNKILSNTDLVKGKLSIEKQTSQSRLGKVSLDEIVRDLSRTIKGIEISEKNGEIWIKTKSGEEVRIISAEELSPDKYALTIAKHYAQEKSRPRIAGMFTNGKNTGGPKTITLVKNVAGIWTLSHEFYHFLEDIGAISNADKAILNKKIASLIASDPDTYGYLEGRSLPEQRADWAGRTLVGIYDPETTSGKIIAKIRNIIDRIINALGSRTAGGVLRDIKSGEIYKNIQKNKHPDEQAQLSVSSRIPLTTRQWKLLNAAEEDGWINSRKVGGKFDSGAKSAEALRELAKMGFVERHEEKFRPGKGNNWAGWWITDKGREYTGAQNDTQLSIAEDMTEKAVSAASRKVSRAIELTTGKLSPEHRAGIATFKKQWKEFWQPFSTVKNGDQILARRYESMGNVAKAVRFIDSMKTELDKFPDAVKKDMFWFLNGDIPLETLPEDAREIAKNIQRRTEIIGEMLVDRGIISQKTFDEHKGKYIHYMYAKHIVGEDSPIGITSSGKLNLSYTLQRNPNLTMQQRKELGLIDDASVAVPVGMGKALTDIAKFDYLEKIADNPDWVWKPSVVRVAIGKKLATAIHGRTRRYVTMGIGKLVEEVNIYSEMLRVRPTPEIAEIHKILTQALDRAQKNTGNVPVDYVQLPNSKGYGPLAGAYVIKPIADDLRPVIDVATDRGKLLNTIVSIEKQGMAAFKMGKVALNFPTAFRNMISNIIQINMSGRSLASIPADLANAAESMKSRDKYFQEASDMGLFNTNWFAAEINDVLKEFRHAESGKFDQIVVMVKNLAKYYGRIDDFFKLALYRQQRESGQSIDKATLHAMKWGMDYSLTSRSIKGLRQTIMPFATYQYKIAPLIGESLKKRPWVLGKFALIYPLAKLIAMSLHGLDDDDWDDLVKQLPSYIKKSGSMMILPWKTDKDQWQWINLEYFFPWGNYLAIFRDAKEKDAGEMLRDAGIGNPFLSMFYTGLSARDDQPPTNSYFGTPVYNELDPAPMKAAKYLEYMANTWMPSMLTRQGAIGYTGKMLAGDEDRWGRSVTLPQSVGRWFGLNIVSVSPEQSRAQVSVHVQDLRKEMARIEADPSRSEEEKAAYRARLNEKLADIAQEAPAAILPITKAKGHDAVYEALKDMAAKGILNTSPPSRTVEISGIPMKMSLDQYKEYLDKSSETARRKLESLVTSPAWEQMTDARKGIVVEHIVSNARKSARQKIKAEMLQNNRDKIMEEKIKKQTQVSKNSALIYEQMMV